MDKRNEKSLHLGASPEIFLRAKNLRANMTTSEMTLWNKLKNRNIFTEKFRRQHPILKFVLDFYCHELKLGIEIDGKQHEERFQSYYDKDRTQIFETYGLTIIRFTNDEVTSELDQVIESIMNEIDKRKNS